MTNFKYESLTFVGRRKNNQDSCYAGEISKGFYFLAVADGMGGAAGGEIASETVLSTAMEVLETKANSEIAPENLKEILGEVFEKSQEALAAKINQNEELTGMGTTLTCVLLLHDKYVWGNIGDSRVYIITENNISQLTEDHTYIQEHINMHGDDIPENLYKTYGHIITRSLNGENDEADIYPFDANYNTISKGKLFLLCSDGLISNKTDKDNSDFHKIIIGNKNLLKSAKNLISFAFHKGSTDNISIVLGEYGNVKRKKISIPEYEYPPKDESNNEDTSIANYSSDIEIPENNKEISNYKTGNKKKFLNRNISKIVLLAVIALLAIGSVGYIFLSKDNKKDKATTGAGIHNEQLKTENFEFEGFEGDKQEINKNPTITWHKYKGNGFKRYEIVISGVEQPIIVDNQNSIRINFSQLGIKNNGEYTLVINVKLLNDKLIPGDQKLTLIVR